MTTLHLAEIKSMFRSRKHTVLLLDQAAWHFSGKVKVLINTTPLLPKCPKLNIMENVCQFMRDDWLSTQGVRNHDDIIDHSCHAWNRRTSQPWRIMSIRLSKWVRG